MEEHQHGHDNCSCKSANTTVHQTIDEMEFERGIWTAAMDNEMERVEKFIGAGKVDAKDNFGYTALHYAARSGHLEMCRIILKGGAQVDSLTKSGGATPLQRAAMKGRVEVVRLLVEKGANVRIQDVDGKTALHRAIEGAVDNDKAKAVIEYLLSVDRSLADIVDNHQQKAEEMAVQRGDGDLMNLFTKDAVVTGIEEH